MENNSHTKPRLGEWEGEGEGEGEEEEEEEEECNFSCLHTIYQNQGRLGEWEWEGEGEGEEEEEEEEEEDCDFNCLHTISFVCFVISLLRLSSRCRG